MNAQNEKVTFEKVIEGFKRITKLNVNQSQITDIISSDISKCSIVVKSLSKLILPTSDALIVNTTIRNDVLNWLSNLYHFSCRDVTFVENVADSVSDALFAAFRQHYPNLQYKGYESFTKHKPIIYISSSVSENLICSIQRKILLPFSNFRIVDCIKNKQSQVDSEIMNLTLLEDMIKSDIESGHKPIFIMACAGTEKLCQCDEILNIKKICEQNNIWLHLHGPLLQYLILLDDTNSHESVNFTDSMTIEFGTWFNIPEIRCLTLYYKSLFPNIPKPSKDISKNIDVNFCTMWLVKFFIKYKELTDRIIEGINATTKLHLAIEKNIFITIMNRNLSQNKKEFITTLNTKIANTLSIFDLDTPQLFFRFELTNHNTKDDLFLYAFKDIVNYTIFFNMCNLWLARTIYATLNYEAFILDHIDGKVYLKYDSYNDVSAASIGNIDKLCDSILKCISILTNTLKNRLKFHNIVKKYHNLRIVNDSHWVGLGAVRCLPKILNFRKDSEDVQNDNVQKILNLLNQRVYNKLMTCDGAFTIAYEEGLGYIRFGLMGPNDDIERLVNLTTEINDMITENINLAKEELKNEQLHKFDQQGLLRQLPIMKSLVNWWSPQKIVTKGCSYNMEIDEISVNKSLYKPNI
ncbi:Pyridoxal-dependent decarboxylase domain-containing protein 1 [Intoshia linei]|uniref:Pyridoxal-dependent decarboxylase domain-containing protein 1 n=1 Tax=Intoshia linei TaxID=1819745 RepID=A0A177BBI0_9BILA|nr:Pyridoxal-dependent decarboxylase domain-containing protein 1 [Intoshia linei]